MFGVSAETGWERCAFTMVYSSRSAATGELAGRRRRGLCLLGFCCESITFDSAGEPTNDLMGAVMGRSNLALRGGKVREGGQDFKSTVAWRCRKSGRESFTGKILPRQPEDRVFDGNRRNNWTTCQWSASMRTKGKRCGGYAKTITHLVPVDRATPRDGALVGKCPD